MPKYHLSDLNRSAYISSIETIQDEKTAAFANMSLLWWDKHYLWASQACVVLKNARNEDLCYVFYQVDRYRQYMTIHNIFTPLSQRRKGYAYTLLKMIFDLAITNHVRRFKITSISTSLDFYLSIGLIYWGVNSVGDYYCDLPIPQEGLASIGMMIKSSDTPTLIGKNFDTIHNKIKGNDTNLSTAQTLVYNSDIAKMGDRYRLQGLLDIKE